MTIRLMATMVSMESMVKIIPLTPMAPLNGDVPHFTHFNDSTGFIDAKKLPFALMDHQHPIFPMAPLTPLAAMKPMVHMDITVCTNGSPMLHMPHCTLTSMMPMDVGDANKSPFALMDHQEPMFPMVPLTPLAAMKPMAHMHNHLHQWIANVSMPPLMPMTSLMPLNIIGDCGRHITNGAT